MERTNRALEKINTDLEKITYRGMKEAVAEYLSSYCFEELDFKECILNPEKDLTGCMKYIFKKAKEYLQNNVEGIELSNGIGGDVPNELCYGWAIDYFKKSEEELYPKRVTPKATEKPKKEEKPKKPEAEQLTLGV